MILSDCVNKYFDNTSCYSDFDSHKAVEVLSKAISYNTSSYADTSKMDGDAFLNLHKHFEESFPLVHKSLTKEVINNWSLIFHWKGSDSSLKPALFMAHLDVVPIVAGTEGDWHQPPFSGNVLDGFIWGRGSIDTKCMVVGELSAVEYLLSKGFVPKRDIYLAYGHDEESMGEDGALAIMKLLKSRGVKLEFVMDEGGGFEDGGHFGAEGVILAKAAVFEKGYADVSIVAKDKGGHSSRPGKGTALGKAARAIAAIEDNQFKPKLDDVLMEFFKAIKPYIKAQPWASLTADLEANRQAIADYMVEQDNLAPLVHTTTAATMISASPTPNVLPSLVEAVFNFRTWDSCEDVVNHCINSANNPNLEIKMLRGMEPSKISSVDSVGYEAIKSAVEKFYKGVVFVPSLVTGGTDCRYFEEICDCCYRFRPYMDNMELGSTVHSTNERCTVDGFVHGIKVFIEVMSTVC